MTWKIGCMETCVAHSHIVDVPVALRWPVMGGWASRLQTDPGAMDPQGRPEEEIDEEVVVEEPEVEAEEEGDEGGEEDVGMGNQQNFVAVQKKKKH